MQATALEASDRAFGLTHAPPRPMPSRLDNNSGLVLLLPAPPCADIMNDEEQRKFITSLKAMMTFCQQKYPPELTSNMVR